MTKQTHTYVVEGSGQFPLDMLRRDGSELISIGYAHFINQRGRRRIMLKTTDDREARWEPLAARWESFRWRVVEHNGEPVRMTDRGLQPSPPTQDSSEYAEAYEAMLAALKDSLSVLPTLIDDGDAPRDREGRALLGRIQFAIAKAESRS